MLVCLDSQGPRPTCGWEIRGDRNSLIACAAPDGSLSTAGAFLHLRYDSEVFRHNNNIRFARGSAAEENGEGKSGI